MKPPNGLHVFSRLTTPETMSNALASIRKLFDIIENGEIDDNVTKGDERFQLRPPLPDAKNNILFIAPGDEHGKTPTYNQVINLLRQYDPEFASYIVEHAQFCARTMGITDEELGRACNITLVHYLPDGGLLAHIDSLKAFGGTSGPIFTVSMNEDEKPFDLFPTLKPEGTPALRVYTWPGEITMMDGEARLLWSHGIPFGSRVHNYTIAFKFPCLDKYLDDRSGGYSEVLECYVPQNLREDLRPDIHHVYDRHDQRRVVTQRPPAQARARDNGRFNTRDDDQWRRSRPGER